MFATLPNGTVLEGTPVELKALIFGTSTVVEPPVESFQWQGMTLTKEEPKVEPVFLPGKWGKVTLANKSTYRRRFPTLAMEGSVCFGLASDKANVKAHSYVAEKTCVGMVWSFLALEDVTS